MDAAPSSAVAAAAPAAAVHPLPASEGHAASWIRWIQAVRSDPDSGWELEPPYEDIECCFICQCEFTFFVRPTLTAILAPRSSEGEATAHSRHCSAIVLRSTTCADRCLLCARDAGRSCGATTAGAADGQPAATTARSSPPSRRCGSATRSESATSASRRRAGPPSPPAATPRTTTKRRRGCSRSPSRSRSRSQSRSTDRRAWPRRDASSAAPPSPSI
jgi:hypothetical protein